MGSMFTVSSTSGASPAAVEIALEFQSQRQHNGALVLAGDLKSDTAIDLAIDRLKADLDEAGAAAKLLLKSPLV
jgi:hypothetical protein